jgi:hypothetical protein
MHPSLKVVSTPAEQSAHRKGVKSTGGFNPT